MTEPFIPAPLPLDWTTTRPTWCCSCEIHQATATKPLCPVCLDTEARTARGEAS